MSDALPKIALYSEVSAYQQEVLALSQQLQIEVSQQANLLLVRNEERWELLGKFKDAPKAPLSIDFIEGKNAWRKKNPGAGKQPIVQAMGIKHSQRPTILDCTAGLGRDAYIFASLGCKVWLTERNPIVAVLLKDALRRAQQHPQTATLFQESMLFAGSTILEAQKKLPKAPEVIYMDPMYPEPSSKRTAKVKKEMQLLRYLVKADEDSALWLAIARKWAKKVVVKRPDWADPIATDMSGSTQSKGHRFDIYLGRDSQSNNTEEL